MNYRNALHLTKHKPLSERRKYLCLKFAKKCLSTRRVLFSTNNYYEKFLGACNYLLTGVVSGTESSRQPWFTVHVSNTKAWSDNEDVSMTERVWLEFKSKYLM